jgi:hypothetical protein
MVASVIGGGNRITLRKPKIQVHLSMNVNLTDKVVSNHKITKIGFSCSTKITIH